MESQTRIETLRDLIVSKTSGVVIGRAIGSDELKRPIGDLCAERDALKLELHGNAAKSAEEDRAKMLDAISAKRRSAVKALVEKYSKEDIASKRSEAKEALASLRETYAELSGAIQYLDIGDKVKAMYNGLSQEEREAFDALSGA